MIDHVENGILLVIDNALGEGLAFHGEGTGGGLPDDVDGVPRPDFEGDAAGVNAQFKWKVAEGGDPRCPQKADRPG